ncbi:MAG TPA: hypothetical protein DCM87_18110 [Planctomycetes bacterium]|nr:hypothetical protein [Planctomycetota bacterium]
MCGEIIKLQGDSETLGAGTHVCERCASKQQSAPVPVKKKAEDISFRPDAPEQEGAAAGSVANEITLEHLLAGAELDLYSADTLARRKATQPPAEPEKPRAAAKIKLLDPDAPAAEHAPATRPGSARVASGQARAARPGSAGVGASRTGSATATAAPPAAAGYIGEKPAQSKDTGSKTVKLPPVRPPDRVRFPCRICGVTLEIAPIMKTSRLHCPKCRAGMSISPDGNVKLLDGGSVAVRISDSKASRAKRKEPPAPPAQDILGAPLLDEHPKAPPEPATWTQPPEPAAPPVPKMPAFDYSGTEVEDFTTAAGPAYRPSHNEEVTLTSSRSRAHEHDEERMPLPHEQRRAVVQLAKTLVLGLALAAPFYLWGLLVYFNQSDQVGIWLETYGDIVNDAFARLLAAR